PSDLEIIQRPGCVLTTGTTAKIGPGQQHTGVFVAILIQQEVWIQGTVGAILIRLAFIQITQLIEQVRAKARTFNGLQKLLGNDHVRVHIGTVHGGNNALVLRKCSHGLSPVAQFINSRTSTKWPVTAAAAAIAGLTRWVRPPKPWRPSKFRLEVDAQCSPCPSLSAFMARHMEQPGSRHSRPASIKTLSRPSCSAWALTKPEPGTTIACLRLAATLRPLTTAAASRRSSIRLLVQEPINTRSSLISVIF